MSSAENAALLVRAKRLLIKRILKCSIILLPFLLLPDGAIADGGSWGVTYTRTDPCPANYVGSGIVMVCRSSNNGSYCQQNPGAWTVKANYCTYSPTTLVETKTNTQYLICPGDTPSGSIYQTQTYDVYSDGSKKNYSAWTEVNQCYNKPPTTSNMTLTILEDTSGTLKLPVSDDGPSPYTFKIIENPGSGVASVAGDTLTYKPDPDWNGSTAVTFVVIDGAGAQSEIATAAITVTPVNDPPVAANLNMTLDEDTTGIATLSATDIDSPLPTVFELLTPSPYGTATISSSVLSFIPNKDWNGVTTVTYRTQDTAGAWSQPATVTINVNPVNDVPTLTNKPLTIQTRESTPMTVRAAVSH